MAISLLPHESSETSGVRRFAKRLAFALDDLTPVREGLVVLAYHRVGGRTVSPVDLPTTTFRRQIESVAHRTISLDAALERTVEESGSTGESPLPIALTFDDGTADFVDIVLPILVEFDVPVTLYLSTANVDSGLHYPGNAVPISWAGLRECLSTGLVTIGAHTHHHVLLDRCSPAEAASELSRCDERIEEELSLRPHHFAYPKAVAPDASIEPLIRDRYRSAAVAGTRPNPIGATDPYRLFRSPIQNADGWDGFVRKVDGGMRLEDDVRRGINLVRYRGKTS